MICVHPALMILGLLVWTVTILIVVSTMIVR